MRCWRRAVKLATGTGTDTRTATAIFAAAATVTSLGLTTWLFVSALQPVADTGRWRAGDVAAASPIPSHPIVAAGGMVILIGIAARLIQRAVRILRSGRPVLALEWTVPSRGLPARLVVVDEPRFVAHAVAGMPGCGRHLCAAASEAAVASWLAELGRGPRRGDLLSIHVSSTEPAIERTQLPLSLQQCRRTLDHGASQLSPGRSRSRRKSRGDSWIAAPDDHCAR